MSSSSKFHAHCWSCLIIVACLLFVAIGDSRQDEQHDSTSTTNQNIELNNNHETMKWNNHKTNNYNYLETKIQPNHNVQVYIGVKKEKKLRVSRPPSVEEYTLKQKIQQVYELALDEVDEPSSYLIHLGRIIKALNPKYIATQRVMRVAFADPNDPDVSVTPPESEIEPPQMGDAGEGGQGDDDGVLVKSIAGATGVQAPVFVLSSKSETPVEDQLANMMTKFSELFTWDSTFALKLSQMDEKKLEPKLVAFKRLVQCVAFPALCYSSTKKKANKQDQPVTYGDNHLQVSIPIAPVKVDFKAPRVASMGPAVAQPAPNRRVGKSTAPPAPPAPPAEINQNTETPEAAISDDYFKTYQSAATKPRQQQPEQQTFYEVEEPGYGYGYGYGIGYDPVQENQGYLIGSQPQFEVQSSAPEPYFASPPSGLPIQNNRDLTHRLQQRFGPLEVQQQQQQLVRQPRNRNMRLKSRRAPNGY